MSGPDLNAPAPGSNAIGLFSIGSSPIGTISPFNVWDTIISQYANSPTLTGLITGFNSSVDPTENLDSFYSLIRNLDTAIGYGLDVWGRIVGVNRVLKLPAGPRYFGFEEGLPDYDPFNQSPFYSGQPLTTNFAVSDDGFRVLILAKAFSNICDGSIPSINKLLRLLFGTVSGKAYVTDDLDMTMTYTFEFALTQLQIAILGQSGVMPRPTGVSVQIIQPMLPPINI